ncbi:hypothetical protein AC244_03325 [Ensifer adhaerens]|uniref:Uncharacterized protein n=1 Tax=Ensifer adhaerens TaxID=106592 RepID=A0A0L8C6Q5_ENSAD|nr:hypothetical protein AC244_03325 [Ensifer adhaerens]
METTHQRYRAPSPQTRKIYSLKELAAVYDLGTQRAEELYERFGPTRSKLDTLMVAIRHSTNWKS